MDIGGTSNPSLIAIASIYPASLIWKTEMQIKTCGSTGCPKIVASRLCGYCGGAVVLTISLLTQLHRSGFNLEIETLFESI